ncbi:MAG: tRNA uridine-5-carboxymethylaminomethyl(34) synthesis GTPase MnmE [Opitutus sp.]|nr:tRNA uridine-5-carboxymethylaminomethyl(34) synthesis GTPase MnmE [Opitutus sp.]MCS6247807.1 tRNA uridine-5-carboxymethylaminomethyl(34) synthesis GTPase MnmE [Opitutus sp.]MCS6274489.1 tRNA uridine-5-carboxymethylaminomethyl(34) synthesis GTPase MnmE [Opitutus sp.]MCS6276653.1 tRNA uridine-5-carboxymethylaminomethyl(34) synthesis GTPase MnmE [Opitutus sp.]MCS6301698.1 tRNA uridine-5-carboxymethylaminomethyl(34) synthesis GTPase MnmE [Opitutus sp.]
MSRTTDTIAALATPVGTAALAVVRASGPDCASLAQAIFGPTPLPPRLARHADYRDQSGRLLDDVLVTFYRGPSSYTGEDSLEISCHGNPFIAQAILKDLLVRGCRAAEAGEFTRRAFLGGKMDLSQAEAVMDLIHARSERALVAANQQLRGSLGRHLGELTEGLLLVLARIEAYIDFPDEDLPAEDRRLVAAELAGVLRGTSRLLATQHYGELLREGIRTVIIGEPNAGKSSLLNALVGHERALVSAEPGTTRDFIEERISLGAHWLRLIDTAGLNPAPAPLEKLGMAKTLERAAEADLFLWVLDATRPCPALPPAVATRLTPANTVVLLNKADLLGSVSGAGGHVVAGGMASPALSPLGLPVLEVSALTGAGLEALTVQVGRLADAFRLDQGDEIIAINARHADALRRANSCLLIASKQVAESGPVELLASDLRGALDALGEIAGKIDNERMLDHLFKTFCIGK